MSLNWKEIGLILEEANLKGSKIQAVVQNNFHALTWELYNREKGRYLFYTEVGTDQSRIHLISAGTKLTKTKKLQRFIQFARKNLEGSIITNCYQMPFDRLVCWELTNHERELKIWIRLYSGPGANIIVTDKDNAILDLLLRRPGRDEISGSHFIPEEKTKSDKEFTIRPYTGTFNEFIEKTCTSEQNEEILEALKKQVRTRFERELARISNSIRSSEKTIEANKDYEIIRKDADLLSASKHLMKKGDETITLTDWSNGNTITLTLDKKLSPGDNVKAIYDRYQREKGTFENAQAELKRLNLEYEQTKLRFEKALEPSEDILFYIGKLKNLLQKTDSPAVINDAPGIRCTSGGFTILAGRNAKENDDLLRHYAKGNDMWLHTRDYPGGYVFIKFRKEKTIPLDVLLDAANLAILFSKARNAGTADLYYTEVRYLRRAKNSKTGLVLPTREKNLTVTFDRARVDRLLQDVPTEHVQGF